MINLDFFKYTFNNIATLVASDDNVIFSIKGAGIPKHNCRIGSYVTPYKVSKNYSAQFRLSLTSSPNFRNMIDSADLLSLETKGGLELIDNKQKNLGTLSNLKLADLPRVWPSYGYFGGAREMFVAFDKSTQLKLTESPKFHISGRRDFYHSDDDEELKMQLILNILQGINSLLGQDDLQNETGNAKITQQGGIAINIENYRQCGVNLTASIAYRDFSGDTFVKCWLNAWNDDEIKLRRKMYFTLETEYFFKGLDLKYLATLQNFPVDVFIPLYNVFLKNYLNSKRCFKRSLFQLSLPL